MHVKKSTGGKLLALFVVLALLIGGAVGGTLAWLVTKTDPVVNTFTAGNINITLDEPNFDNTNAYKILPGDTIDKDPTVTVEAGSEDCYVRMFMLINWTPEADRSFVGEESTEWFDIDIVNWTPGDKKIDNDPGVVKGHIYEFRYKEKVLYSKENIELPALFKTVSVPGSLSQQQYESLDSATVTVIAQAVQSLGSENAAEAFEKAGIPDVVQQAIYDYENAVPFA